MSTANPPQFMNIRPLIEQLIKKRSWLIAFLLFDLLILIQIITVPEIQGAAGFIFPGIGMTLQLTIWAFILALFVGLIVAIGRISKNVFIYNLSTLYVELFRGLPLLVIILIFSFVITPAIVTFISGSRDDGLTPPIPILDDFIQRLVGIPEDRIATTNLRTRDIDESIRIIFAFALTYGAFTSEVFRAGIESIGKGQMEAANSVGMNFFQGMWYIVLPQAIRNVLPALVNNFVFLLKDTSLAVVVAVPEISQLTRQYYSNNFRYSESLLVLSFLYANMTILLSALAYILEARLQKHREGTR
jgi:polar amino acid transport system permease protein